MSEFPQGKYMATVKIGPKGQIVIPQEARELFGLKAGDALVLMADKGQGIALQPFSYIQSFWQELCKIKGEE